MPLKISILIIWNLPLFWVPHRNTLQMFNQLTSLEMVYTFFCPEHRLWLLVTLTGWTSWQLKSIFWLSSWNPGSFVERFLIYWIAALPEDIKNEQNTKLFLNKLKRFTLENVKPWENCRVLFCFVLFFFPLKVVIKAKLQQLVTVMYLNTLRQ